VIALFAAAALVLGLFTVVERRVKEPMVDLRLVVARPFRNANVCAFVFGYGFFIAVFAIPQLAAAPEASGYGLSFSTTEIGLVLAPVSIAGLVGSWLGGRVVDRVGPRALAAAGSVVGVLGYVFLASAHAAASELALGGAAIGLGSGFLLTAVYPVVLRGASADKTGIAVAVMVVFRNTAVSVGVTVAFVIIAAAGLKDGFAAEAGYTRTFTMAAASAGLALLASALLPGRSRAAPVA
jgi:MFS family permease